MVLLANQILLHMFRFNPYMVALNAVSSVIEKYNRHGRIAALGFGAQTPPDYKVSHLFFLVSTPLIILIVFLKLMIAYKSVPVDK